MWSRPQAETFDFFTTLMSALDADSVARGMQTTLSAHGLAIVRLQQQLAQQTAINHVQGVNIARILLTASVRPAPVSAAAPASPMLRFKLPSRAPSSTAPSSPAARDGRAIAGAYPNSPFDVDAIAKLDSAELAAPRTSPGGRRSVLGEISAHELGARDGSNGQQPAPQSSSLPPCAIEPLETGTRS